MPVMKLFRWKQDMAANKSISTKLRNVYKEAKENNVKSRPPQQKMCITAKEYILVSEGAQLISIVIPFRLQYTLLEF